MLSQVEGEQSGAEEAVAAQQTFLKNKIYKRKLTKKNANKILLFEESFDLFNTWNSE